MFHGFLFLALCAALYFLPSILGAQKRNAIAIFVLNLFLGWTLVGWVVALVWALSETGPTVFQPVPQPVPQPYPQPAPHPQPPPQPAPQSPTGYCSKCGTALHAGNKYCPSCGSPTGQG